MPYPLATFGILINSLAALAAGLVLAGLWDWWPFRPLRDGVLRPLALAITVHWFIYFGPINLCALWLKSDTQVMFAWVIRRSQISEASLYGFVAYGMVLSVLALIAWLLQRSGWARELRLIPRWPRAQVLAVTILLALMALLVHPVFGMPVANGGAWMAMLPLPLQPFSKGLFLIEAIPLIATGWQVLSASGPPSWRQRWFFVLIAILQLVTFILLRQRFLALMAVAWFAGCLLRWWRKPSLVLGVPLGMCLVYSIATALRFTRREQSYGESRADYLQHTFGYFIEGLIPANLGASALNDFSYNKAGAASLSVVLDLREQGLIRVHQPLAWLSAELYRALPGHIKPAFMSWGALNAEQLVSRALGVGEPGWSNPGVHAHLALGWVVDMMETPLLDPVASAGWLGMLFFAGLAPILLAILWCMSCRLVRWMPCLWLLPMGILAIVALGTSWLGDILVFLKVVGPWLLLCLLIATIHGWHLRESPA